MVSEANADNSDEEDQEEQELKKDEDEEEEHLDEWMLIIVLKDYVMTSTLKL